MEENIIWAVVGVEDCKDFAYKQEFNYDDGGRELAGFKGESGDCVTRSIAIVTGKSYKEVYDALNVLSESEHIGKRKKKKSNSRTGVFKTTYDKYLKSLGYEWTPTMGIGTGCKTHLCGRELPDGKLIVKVSRHMTAVIDGAIHDTHDCSRTGTRCVYGYYHKKVANPI